jgi:CelD/BcsL family acetyltransferase involved in cellulose biosynthesis
MRKLMHAATGEPDNPVQLSAKLAQAKACGHNPGYRTASNRFRTQAKACGCRAIIAPMLTATRTQLRVQPVEGKDALDRLRSEWYRLEEEGAAETFFQTWDWNFLWWKHFCGSKKLHLTTLCADDRVVAISPNYLDGTILPVMRWIGSGSSDYLGMVVHPKDEEEAARHFRSYLQEDAPIRMADLHQISHPSPLADEFSDTCFEQAKTVRLRLPGSWTEYQGTLSAKMRSNVKRAVRDAEAAGATVRLAPRAEVDKAMSTLFRLHGQRWRSRGLPGSFATGATKRFHADWARVASDRNMLRLYILEVAGKALGALYCLRYRDTYYYYQAGFDPRSARLSPGTVLVARAIQDAIAEGCKEFDFLRGEEWYKSRWKPTETHVNVRATVPIRGTGSRWYCNWLRKTHEVELALRRRFEGGSLWRAPKQEQG